MVHDICVHACVSVSVCDCVCVCERVCVCACVRACMCLCACRHSRARKLIACLRMCMHVHVRAVNIQKNANVSDVDCYFFLPMLC